MVVIQQALGFPSDSGPDNTDMHDFGFQNGRGSDYTTEPVETFFVGLSALTARHRCVCKQLKQLTYRLGSSLIRGCKTC